MHHKKHDFYHHHHHHDHNQEMKNDKPISDESILEQLGQKPGDPTAAIAGHDLTEAEEHELIEPLNKSQQELRDEITHLQEELEKSKNQFLRALAEVENTRRLSKLDLEKAHKFGIESFAKALLPIMDSLEKTLENCAKAGETPSAALKEGAELTHKMFLKTLEQFGVQCVDPMLQPFNPAQHEAISTEIHTDKSENTVVAVLQKGYELNKRLIRPALVIVSKKT